MLKYLLVERMEVTKESMLERKNKGVNIISERSSFIKKWKSVVPKLSANK
jgi:hypothetical protein